MRWQRSSFFWVGGLVLLSIVAGGLVRFTRPPRLNVILITLDTTRADRIGCYGYSQARTPAIDELAANGVIFERAYCPVPVTLPSHASMMTGLYPPEHGLHSNGRGRLGEGIPVLAETFQKANYETGAFVASFVLDSKFGLDRGFQTYNDDLAEANANDPEHRRRDGRAVVDAAIEWLRGRTGKPFFCWIHLYDVHAYYETRPEIFGDEFKERPYDAGIAYVDLQIQRIRDNLLKHKLESRTLVVIVGDHGEDLMDHQEPQHGNQLYDTELRVPLVFSGTDHVKSGQRVTVPVSVVDLMPTILECAGLKQKESSSGRSLKPALGGITIANRPCYAETDIPFLENRWSPQRAIVSDRWKYIESTESELYDLIDDPHETRNLALTNPRKFRELQNEFDELIGTMIPRAAASVNLTAHEQRVLESLGYVGGKSLPKQPESNERLPDVKVMLPLMNDAMIARTMIRDGKIEAATTLLQSVLEKAPDYFQAQLLMGDALAARNEFEAAIKIYQDVAVNRPDIGDAEGRWATALSKQGRFAEAVPHYQKVLKVLPEAYQYRVMLATCFLQLRKPQNAVAEFEEAIRTNPEQVDAHLELANFLMQAGRMHAAIPHFEAVLKVQPNLRLAGLNLASALAHVGRFSEAIHHATKQVEADPENFEARYTLAMILVTQHRSAEAIPHLEVACRLRPEDESAKAELQQARAVTNSKRLR